LGYELTWHAKEAFMPATQTQTQRRVIFRNILCATDFSDSAKRAAAYAAGLARSFGAQLYALHVQEPVNYALPPEAWQASQEFDEAEIKSLRESLGAQFPETTPHVIVRTGGFWPELHAAIKTNSIDLIVVGTHGRTGVSKVALGSRAEEILRHASCPVLAVGPHVHSVERERGKLESILFATNFGPSSLKVAPIAVSLAQDFQSKLTLLHVIEQPAAASENAGEEFGEATGQMLRDLVPEDANLWCRPHYAIETGSPVDRILAVARRTNADLIVLGAHKERGVSGASTHLPTSIVHQVLARAECPVLTIRS
jgi:nucleotide-binding universal stress UspA family protein